MIFPAHPVNNQTADALGLKISGKLLHGFIFEHGKKESNHVQVQLHCLMDCPLDILHVNLVDCLGLLV